MALLVARKVGYSWGNSLVVRAAALPKPLVESRCDGVVPPRNETVIGSIPIGGSTPKPQVRGHFPRPGVSSFRPQAPSVPRGAPDLPGGIPQVLIDQVSIPVHRHGRRGVPQDPLNDLRSAPDPSQTDAAVWRRSWTRRVGTPMALIAADQRTDRFQSPSLSGPPLGAWNSQAPFTFSPAQRSTRGDQLVDQGQGPGAFVLQGVYEQLAGSSACQHSSLKVEISTRQRAMQASCA
ncbi:MAG: hypothetical protein QOG10_7183 [Kribbellaceae bacterium]|nr:hypothetical protein [Kribbellaceae bacterium]